MVTRVFVTGQSNCLGRGTGGPEWSGISGVRVWDNANPLGANGTAWRTPVLARSTYSTFENTDRGNAAVWFCDRLAGYLGDTVDMTIVARGGTLISGWEPGNVIGMYEECLAVYAATGQPAADVMVWQQGESNATTSATGYRDAFLDVLAGFEANGIIDANTVIVLGGTPESGNAGAPDRVVFNRDTYDAIMAADSRCARARSDGLMTYDGLHYTADALYVLGAFRMMDAYVEGTTDMPSIWAMVNEGGTPGSAGSGANKVADLESLLTEGYRPSGPPIYLTASQTWTVPAGTSAIEVFVQGAGGGGAGAASASSVARVGGGGGGGGSCHAFISTLAASYAVTIGAGGAGGAAGQNNGAAGGATSFGALSATGGGAGTTFSSSSDIVVAGAGAGGSSSSGDFNVSGNAGTQGLKLSAAARVGGRGGNSRLGSGGASGNASSAASSITNGGDGSGFGAGGGGGVSNSTTDAAGGDGADGVVIVQCFKTG